MSNCDDSTDIDCNTGVAGVGYDGSYYQNDDGTYSYGNGGYYGGGYVAPPSQFDNEEICENMLVGSINEGDAEGRVLTMPPKRSKGGKGGKDDKKARACKGKSSTGKKGKKGKNSKEKAKADALAAQKEIDDLRKDPDALGNVGQDPEPVTNDPPTADPQEWNTNPENGTRVHPRFKKMERGWNLDSKNGTFILKKTQ